jgi:hypothetical protein
MAFAVVAAVRVVGGCDERRGALRILVSEEVAPYEQEGQSPEGTTQFSPAL